MDPKFTVRISWDDLLSIRVDGGGAPVHLIVAVLREAVAEIERQLLADKLARAVQDQRLFSRVIGGPKIG